MKKKIIIATFTLLFILTFSSGLSCSQATTKQSIIDNSHNINVNQQKPQIKPDYIKVSEITEWDIEISKYFVNEANDRNVLVFDEALPVIGVETGSTYDFNLVHYNINDTKDVGIFQINDITKQDIVKQLKAEDREFNSWSRLNREFNISGGLCWMSYLKGKGLEGHELFTSYNKGIAGAKNYASRNGTYVSRYSRDVVKTRNEINNVINN